MIGNAGAVLLLRSCRRGCRCAWAAAEAATKTGRAHIRGEALARNGGIMDMKEGRKRLLEIGKAACEKPFVALF